MKVRQLIEELSKCNPEADVEVNLDGLCDENISVKGVENHAPNTVTIIMDEL